MQLLQHGLQLLRDRQAKVGRVLDEGQALVGQVEEDDGGAQDAAGSDDMGVQHMTDAHQREDQHLPADAFEAHAAGQLPVGDCAEDARHVVQGNEQQQGIKKAIAAAEKISQPAADGGEHELDGAPEFFHKLVPSFLISVMKKATRYGRSSSMAVIFAMK